ncbi:MAG: hypothetical protein L0J18_11115 [Tetragenococcus koreensis]|nr:hypothetical protein [Tetragenococcus koreensis]
MFKTIEDEKKALKKLYSETKDPVVQLHLIAFGKSINKLLENKELSFFDTLNKKENMEKVIHGIDYDKMNKWLLDKGHL